MQAPRPRALGAAAPFLGAFALACLLPAAARASGATEETKLFPADGSADFGHGVDLSGDTAIVGAVGDDDLGILAGAAYVYVRGPGGWTR